MGVELDMGQEIASVCAALSEISAISAVISQEINNVEFMSRYSNITTKIAKCSDVLLTNLRPFQELDTESAFVSNFDMRHSEYTECYLREISKPRTYSDQAYEEYLLLRTLKDCKTGYPLLKRTFERLDKFIDKWITNDEWLAMGIDNLFKRLQTLFNEIALAKKKDPVDAFTIYNGAIQAISPYVRLAGELGESLQRQAEPVQIKQAAEM